MAYVTPTAVTAGDAVTAASYNVLVNNDIALRSGHLIHTTTERNALSSPLTGTEIYNTTTGAFEMYNGTSWVINRPFAVASGTSTSTAGAVVVSYPANRFTVTPLVICQKVQDGNFSLGNGWVITANSTASFTYIWADAYAGSGQAGRILHYQAIQMTATSAAG